MPITLPVLPPSQIPGVYRYASQNDSTQTSADFSNVIKDLSNVSVFWTNKPYFDDAKKLLQQTAGLVTDWDTYGGEPPNLRSRELAAKVIAIMEQESLPPSRLLASSEGGICISIIKGSSRAVIETYNSGEIAAATYSDVEHPITWDLESSESAIKDTLEKIRVRISA